MTEWRDPSITDESKPMVRDPALNLFGPAAPKQSYLRADRIIAAMDKTIGNKTVTYDFARLMEGAREVKCSEFGDLLIQNM